MSDLIHVTGTSSRHKVVAVSATGVSPVATTSVRAPQPQRLPVAFNPRPAADGRSPLLVIEAADGRRVMKITGWTPSTVAGYIGPSGIVETAEEAVDLGSEAVELRVEEGMLQWRQGEGAWVNLYDFASLEQAVADETERALLAEGSLAEEIDGKEPAQAAATQQEAEQGTVNDIRSWSPVRLWQAIAAWWSTINVAWNDLTGTLEILPFDTTNGGPVNTGEVGWVSEDGCLTVALEHGVMLQIGEETLYRVDNNTGSTIPDGTPVMYAGTVGSSGKMRVKPWDGTTPMSFMGIATSNIETGDSGYVTHFGKVRGIQTNGANYGQTWAAGNIIYAVSGSSNLTNVAPSVGGYVTVAVVVSSHASNGTLFVRPTHTPSISDIGAAASGHTHGNLSNDGKIGSTSGVPIITGASGILQAGSFGTTAGTFTQGNDSRLSDARTPTAHKSTHATGGSDALAYSDIGAQPKTVVSDTAPVSPVDGLSWFNTTNGQTYVWYAAESVWVTDASPTPSSGDIAAMVDSSIAATPEETDIVAVVTPGTTDVLKKLTFANLWTWIKSKIDAGQTWAGVHSFSSTTRPTSSGTGTPASNSLITLSDRDARELRNMNRVINLNNPSQATLNGGATSLSGVDGDVLRVEPGNTTPRPIIARARSITANAASGAANAVTPVQVAMLAFIGLGNNGLTRARFYHGGASNTAPAYSDQQPITGRGFGWEAYYSTANSRYELAIFAHNGSNYVSTDGLSGRASPLVVPSLGNFAHHYIIIGLDASGNVSLWLNAGMDPPGNTPSLVLAGGPTSGSYGTYGGLVWALVGPSSGTAGAFSDMRIIDRKMLLNP